ncbi:preprotein translocase subunit YajC [Candidatus Palibaumannia cicadellinicola]|uniref:Sec translocon accessory complex subunit YajC n=1 Tax=Baumannia cicadellinicola subsp. Homalodisca coagulata TaxID=374463 RepID=Q1LSN9_BAUCH|nr:preprotein translocase subunit YajC [Candidatus Baumannia cicadellinicola]ABF14023.1 Preprotein translocase YajC [Baumannia cicadellinicola str. Hc (Homalodisca coagulata)]MCJ7461940.1 preprotein translocase subunit YajC [Candidatus Baumannia cicadellinicola]MCJ7463106.1 preprotein translocase subunit YajC [Candidatus Baumannia cicadellinicola]
MLSIISDAIASTSTSYQGSSYSMIIMLLFFGLFFYFIILRPQQKRAKLHKALIHSITKGDEILTNGGLVGKVAKVTETGYFLVSLNDTNEVLIKRDFITAILPKGTIKSL